MELLGTILGCIVLVVGLGIVGISIWYLNSKEGKKDLEKQVERYL